jgi:hypothetical protein
VKGANLLERRRIEHLNVSGCWCKDTQCGIQAAGYVRTTQGTCIMYTMLHTTRLAMYQGTCIMYTMLHTTRLAI